jgi:RNA-directed DNA polymerase
MKEPYGKGLATHAGPKSCADTREGSREALTGVRAGRVYSRESHLLQGADAVRRSGRPHLEHRQREMLQSPARSETPSTCGYTLRENRELLGLPAADGAAGRVGKSMDTRRR